MASIYSCSECDSNLNLNSAYLFPPDFHFEARNKGITSFFVVDATKFRFKQEDKIRSFFETISYWEIRRKKAMIKCSSCGCLVGYVYDDGPPLTDSPGQFHMVPSQVTSRSPICRFKTKALQITSQTGLSHCFSSIRLHRLLLPSLCYFYFLANHKLFILVCGFLGSHFRFLYFIFDLFSMGCSSTALIIARV
ncbi:uncharacterized protein LOC129312339 [Prosopis cineraria]|uniref:uncharacterized protein LOC129312339 n=1 Tax=Prosopis cineraria TaxID=364024 RepID=UPI00240FC69C|nr:uncharacterized protein LOC129312339 [Prosopis cineraria]